MTAALVGASYAFRSPVLLNARATNSDAAVVGLQAMHLLRGEWSPFLWGSGYQTSADSIVTAAFFAVMGPTALALTLSSLTLHVVLTLLVFRTLRAHLPLGKATLLTLPLVFTSATVHTYALYPPRQLSLTLAVGALAAIDVASRRERRDEGYREAGRRGEPRETFWAGERWLGFGGLLGTLAVAADPYAMLLLPLVGSFGVMVARKRARAVAALGVGLLAGALPFFVLRSLPGATHGQLGLALDKIRPNLYLLADRCLPWTLGMKTFVTTNTLDYWTALLPDDLGALGFAGTVALVALLMTSVAACLGRARSTLGFVALLGVPLTLCAFLASVMVFDHFAMRYLVALPLLVPFALLPAARTLRSAVLATLLLVHVAATGLAGWIGFAPFVAGPRLVDDAMDAGADDALHDALVARGVRAATADYWASYRLTFDWREDVLVVPLAPEQDRYRPYREAFDRADVVALLHDGRRSRETPDETARRAAVAGRELEHFRVDSTKELDHGYDVWIVARRR